jgi:adenine-specific DNA-methyltransferase
LIKYLGSKRSLLPQLTQLAAATEAKTALDVFTGTTRVARALKSLGMFVTAIDSASYSEIFAKTWLELDAEKVDRIQLLEAIAFLNSLPGEDGYFTENFCRRARFFQEHNGLKIDAIRTAIERDFRGSWLYYPLLTSLIMAADKVDSTTGVQMAYLKSWSTRSARELQLIDPELLIGSGRGIRADVSAVAASLPEVDLAYIDPPYNQHRYYANYHIWETLVRWDQPESYGIANKRIDVRDPQNKSLFNSKLTMPQALGSLIRDLKTKTLILSYNNESWLSRRELTDMCSGFESVEIVDFDFKRYVGGQIGGYNQSGELVGKPGAKRNLEHLVLAGSKVVVTRMLRELKA